MAAGAVVVTGASSGIGEAIARHLASLGFHVFAGVRKEEDAGRLREAGLRPLELDVTDGDSIVAAKEQVEGIMGGWLSGLVNNAGIAVSGPIEFLPVEEFRHQLEVNVVGQMAVTQAFLPLLRQARGRIVNISSIGGRVALPLLGPYAASKFALEGLSDALRRELRPHGVEVVVVEPGGIKTPIWDKGNATADSLMESMPPEASELYGDTVEAVRRRSREVAEERGLPPEAVAEVVGEALTARKPRTRYLVGRDAKLRAAIAKRVPDRAMDALIDRGLSD
jgi:NAD(P)-dependent dehydrogenase (short-subunit alcohol dehydrogenase family)